MHVLYIDDDRIDRKSFDRLMNKMATYHWSTCDSLAAAKEILSNQSIDLILADYFLKGNTADELLEIVSDLPIYVVSGDKELDKELDLVALGFNGFFEKPLKENKLKEIFGQLQDSPDELNLTSDNDLMAYIKTISDGDEVFEQEMLQVIVEELPIEMQLLQDHFLSKEWLALGGLLHKMKSKITMLGAFSLREEVAKYEQIAKKNSAIDKGSFDDLMLKLENLNTSVVLLFKSRKFI